MNEENRVVKPEKKKKKRSFWWLWLLLILVVFAGGVILGLKLNTMPEPYAIVSRYFPALAPSQNNETGTAVAAAPAPTLTPVPTEVPAPVETEMPKVTAAPAEHPEEPSENPDNELPLEDTEKPKEDPAPALEANDEPKAEGRPVFGKRDEPETEEEESSAAQTIGIDRAFAAALDHAGYEKEEVELSGVFKTDDAGTTVYQVEFTADGRDYEYRINAETAEVEGWRSMRQSTRSIEEYYAEAPEVEPELFPSAYHVKTTQ